MIKATQSKHCYYNLVITKLTIYAQSTHNVNNSRHNLVMHKVVIYLHKQQLS